MSVSLFRHFEMSLCALLEYVVEGSGSLNAGFLGLTGESLLGSCEVEEQPVTLSTSRLSSSAESTHARSRGALGINDSIKAADACGSVCLDDFKLSFDTFSLLRAMAPVLHLPSANGCN